MVSDKIFRMCPVVNSEDIVFQVKHDFRYSFDEPILINELVKSLKAYQSLSSSFLPKILNNIFDVKIKGVEIFVSEIERGSLLEKLLLNIMFKDEQACNEFCSKIRTFLGLEKHDGHTNMSRLITLIMTALVGVGAYYLFFEKSDKSKQEVINNLITVINTNNDTPITGDQIVKIVQNTTNSFKQKTANNVSDIYAPARKYKGNLDLGDGDIRIEPVNTKILQNMPTSVDINYESMDQKFQDIDLQIRATDRDKITGWYAVIENIVPKRVRLVLPKDINLNKLANNSKIRANVRIEYTLKKNGARKPKQIILESIVTDQCSVMIYLQSHN